MEIRQLVTHIADALGPEVTPARVEAVAAAVLDFVGTEDDSTASLASPGTGDRTILTAFGYDHPGILAGITAALSEAGCNILDVSQKILQGYFTLIMMLDVTPMRDSLQALQEKLNQAGERLGVRILIQHEDLFNAMHRP